MPESAPTRRAFPKTASAAVVASVLRSAPVLGHGHEAQSPQQDPALTAWPKTPGANGILPAPEAIFRPTSSGGMAQRVPACALEARVLSASALDRLAPVQQLTSSHPTEVVIGGFQASSDFYLLCQFRRPPDKGWMTSPLRRVLTVGLPGSVFCVALVAYLHVVTTFEKPPDPQNLSRAREHLQQAKPTSVAPGERRAEERKVRAEKGGLNHEIQVGTNHERRRP